MPEYSIVITKKGREKIVKNEISHVSKIFTQNNFKILRAHFNF